MMRLLTIKKILFVLFWIAIAAGMGFLLNAAWKRAGQSVCRDLDIRRVDGDSFVFVKRPDLERLIRQRTGGKIIGQLQERFPLQKMEDSMRTFIGVSDAQIYFDNRSILNVRIRERVPVARLFLTNGVSCYLDAEGKILPLSEQVVISCPVFNGVKVNGIRPDSTVARHIVSLAQFVRSDSFWSAQAGHFEVDEKGAFEMIPVAGNHRVLLGTAEDPAVVFRRLSLFYRQVLGPQGLDKYARIDVRYQGQVVASRNRYPTIPDSTRIREQVDVLIRAGMSADTVTSSMKPIKRAT